MISGDRIKLIKPMGAFTNVGEICEVISVTEDGVISFRFGKNGVHLGCMSYDEFEKYFELVEKEEPKKREWSRWVGLWINYSNFNGEERESFVLYRNNKKKVQIKYKYRGKKVIKAESSCYKDDEFLIAKGLELAKRRLIVKILKYETDQYAKTL